MKIVGQALTCVSFFGCIVVLLHYAPEAFRAMRAWFVRGEHIDKSGWLINGIVISFTFTLAAQFVWNIAWAGTLLGRGLEWWIENGTAINIALRFGPIPVAAACHIYAARKANKSLGWKVIAWAGLMAISLLALNFALASMDESTR